MVCGKCQARLIEKYDKKLKALTPGQRNGWLGRRLASWYRMLFNGTCNCPDA
jgi:hypothetical protein